MFRFVLLFAIFISNFNNIFGQRFNVSEIDASQYPKVSANFSAFNELGEYYLNLKKDDFRVVENGSDVDPELINLVCTNNLPVNVVLVLDKSSSMNDKIDGETLWQWTLEGAKTFINTFPLSDSSKVAITTFSGSSKLVCDFSSDRKELIDSIQKLPNPFGPTNFNNPFLDIESGAINLLMTRPSHHRRAIVFLSDGVHESGTVLARQDILKGLNELNIRFFGITLLLERSPDLDFWSANTAGKSVYVASKDALNSIYKTFAEDLKMTVQCMIEWISPDICDLSETFRKVDLHFILGDVVRSRNYRAPEEAIVHIETNEAFYKFGDPPLGQTTDNEIVITPKVKQFLVTGIKVIPSQYFEIVDYGLGIGKIPNYPFNLPEDVERTIKVRFKPTTEQRLRQATLMIEGTPCPIEIPLIGGFQQILIDSPFDGSVTSRCDTVKIKWSGVDSRVLVDLSYSTDEGKTWRLIKEKVNGGKYDWYPEFESQNILIKAKVADQFGYDFVRSYGRSGYEYATSIAIQSNGLYSLASGFFSGNLDLDGTRIESTGLEDFFLAKFDIDGNPVWIRTAGTRTHNDRANGVSLDPRGFAYLTGTTYQGIKFGNVSPMLELPNKKHLFITKYSPSGQYINTAFIGPTTEYDDFEAEGLRVKSISAFGEQNKIAVIGRYKGYFYDYSLNVALPSPEKDSLFTAVFDEYLNLIELYPGVISEVGFSDTVALHAETLTRYNIGNFVDSKVVAGKNLLSGGLTDFWITKYAKNPISQDITENFEVLRPSAVLIANEYDFGPVVFGEEVNQTVSAFITNNSKLPYTITRYKIRDIADKDMPDFKIITEIVGMTIEPGKSLDVEMWFKPGYLNKRSATLTIIADCAFDIKIELLGEGVCGGVAPEEYNFGDVNLNKQKTDTLFCVFQNISESSTVISPLIRGQNAGDFVRILPDYVKAKEFNGKITVAPGECIDIIVVFEPKALGLRQADLNFFVQAPCKNSITKLIGNGITSDVGVTSYDWSERRVRGKYPASIDIINNSNVPELIENIQFENGNIGNTFSFSGPNVPINIPANGKITIDVEFNPLDEIVYSENISVFIASRAEPLISELRGIGILPKLTTVVSCGEPVSIGETTQAEITLSNPSKSSVLRINSIVIENQDEFEFPNGTITNNLIIDLESSITLPVLYTPISGGTNSDNFIILADDYDGTYTEDWNTTIVPIVCDGLEIEYPETINFENLIVCTNRKLPITISNKSKDSDIILNLSNMSINGINSDVFILPTLDDYVLKGGSSLTFDLEFVPNNFSNYNGELRIPNSLSNDIIINLLGSGVAITLKAVPNEISVNTGEKAKISIIGNLPSTYSGFITKIKIAFSLDPVVAGIITNTLRKGNLVENDFAWGDLIAKVGGYYEIEGVGSLVAGREIELMSFDIQTYLNDKHRTILVGDIDYGCNTNSNELTIINTEEVCLNDKRLIQMLSGFQFSISQPLPNPATESFILNYSIGFDTETRIEMINYYGECIKVIKEGTVKAGDYYEQIPVSQLSSGTYMIKMISGPYVETKQVVIVK